MHMIRQHIGERALICRYDPSEMKIPADLSAGNDYPAL